MKRTVIVVDDEPITRMDIAGILSEAGFDVLAEGGDGFDAIELCRRHRPDAALLDIKMPTFDGLSAASTILKEDLAGCVVLLTAFSDKDFVGRAKQVGVAGYLIKPVEERTLLSTVEIAIAQGIRYREARTQSETIRRKLDDRNQIDRAKSAVARRDGVTEAQAYGQIQKMAMDKGLTMAEIARIILDASEDRSDTDSAKKFLMEKYRLSENAAFRRIRDLAGERGIGLPEAAREILRKGEVKR